MIRMYSATSNWRHMPKVVLLLALGFSLSGCNSGDARGRIIGKVTFQGHAVEEGMVLFHNNDKGVHMTASLDPEGRYEMTMPKLGGLPVGTYLVCVRPPDPPLPPLGGREMPGKKYPNIPQRFREQATSGLILIVKEGENTFDIAM